MAHSTAADDSAFVAARAERRWAVVVGVIIALLLAMIAYSSVHWAMMPAVRIETVDPTTLHLSGEFVEENLGSALEPDGSVTVRLIAQQYSFTPACILVPARTPLTFRATSADVIHGFIIDRTNLNIMLEPGYVSVFRGSLPRTGDHVMPCHEFCGMGHAAMWARVRVIDRDEFMSRARAAAPGRLDCAR